MNFVMSLLVAATFATPAFAAGKEAKTVSSKNRAEIKKVLEEAKAKDATKVAAANEEEKRGAGAYRLVEVKDPNESKALKSERSVTVRPWTGSNRRRILTPPEYEREQREGKYSTYAGSEVGLHYSTVYGAKVKIPFGAKQ